MENPNSIRVILSDQAEKVLENILGSFHLEEKNVIADHLIKSFVKEVISEKEFTSSLQNQMSVSKEVADNLAKELMTKLIPIIEKIPEEKFKDPIFVEEFSKKIFREGKVENNSESPITRKPNFLDIEEVEKKASMQVKELPKNLTTPKKPRPSGPDKYREEIS